MVQPSGVTGGGMGGFIPGAVNDGQFSNSVSAGGFVTETAAVIVRASVVVTFSNWIFAVPVLPPAVAVTVHVPASHP